MKIGVRLELGEGHGGTSKPPLQILRPDGYEGVIGTPE